MLRKAAINPTQANRRRAAKAATKAAELKAGLLKPKGPSMTWITKLLLVYATYAIIKSLHSTS